MEHQRFCEALQKAYCQVILPKHTEGIYFLRIVLNFPSHVYVFCSTKCPPIQSCQNKSLTSSCARSVFSMCLAFQDEIEIKILSFWGLYF
jgi:hypothetical protein